MVGQSISNPVLIRDRVLEATALGAVSCCFTYSKCIQRQSRGHRRRRRLAVTRADSLQCEQQPWHLVAIYILTSVI